MEQRNFLKLKTDELIDFYNKTGDGAYLDKIESLFEHYLNEFSRDSEIWIRFSLFLCESSFFDNEKAIICLEKVLEYDPKNIIAIIILSEIYDQHSCIPDQFFVRMISLKNLDNQYQSMIEQMIANYFASKNKERYTLHLLRSIALCPKFVRNYFYLGNIYKSKEPDLAVHFCRSALANIKTIVDTDQQGKFDVFSIEHFFDEYIKGTTVTAGFRRIIEQTLNEAIANSKSC